MADTNANIRIGVDTSDALAQIKGLQRQISLFHSQMASSGKAAADQSARMQANLVNSINATRGFTARMTTIKTTTESFTNALEKNKLSMGQYFRYAGGATKKFGSLFKSEFNTIEKVARERVKDLQTQYIKLGRDANGAMKAISVRPTALDMNNFGTQTAIAAQKTQLLNQLLKQGSTNLLNWGKNTQWAGRQLMVGFTIPLTIFGGIAAKTFMDLEEQAIKFKRVYGDMFTSNKEVEQALEGVRQLATEFTKFGVAVEDTINLAASVAQMGAVGADLTNQVTEATRLAVLGGIEQQEALDTTISLTNAFGLATEELSGKIAFLNAVENQTILSIEDFNEAIPKAGSVVKQLGGDVEDLAYFLTAMREGGINASQSANALKSSLARLINPTEVAQQKLAGFGIDILGIVNNNAGNLRATIQVLAQELDKLDPLDKSRAIEQLFGKFQFARMSTLFENIVKEGSQANKTLELTTNSTEELAIIAERELGRVADSPAYKFKKALEEFQAALAPIGKAFLELATPLIKFGQRVLDQFNNLSDGAKQFIVGLTAVAGVVAPALIMVIGLVANGIANMIKMGLAIRNVFGKSKQSTGLLTDQFEYMNQEQIEAAAVAASLDQVHSKLRQTFTSEAAAVDRLTAAYERAVAKQRLMMMSGPRGAATSPKKYNKGVVSVPGSGSRDTQPAMLTPGEAVIPAEMAERYAPLIGAMIDGVIPGYNQGFKPAASHITTALDPTSRSVQEQMRAMYPGMSQSQMANLEILSDLTMDLPSWMNNDLRESAGGIDPDTFQQGSRAVTGKLKSTAAVAAQDMGLELGDEYLSGLSQGFEDEITDRASGLARGRGVNVTDSILSEARNEVLEDARRQGGDRGKLAEGLQGRGQMVGSYRTRFSGEGTEDEQLRKMMREGKVAARKGERGGTELYFVDENGKVGPKAGRFTDSKSRKAASQFYANAKVNEQGIYVDDQGNPLAPPSGARMRGTSVQPSRVGGQPSYYARRKKSGAQLVDPAVASKKEFNDQAAKSAKTNSESKRTRKIAKDTVDGYANELERGKKKVNRTAKEQAKIEERNRARLYGGAQPTTQDKAARRQAEKRAKREAAEQKRIAKIRREQNLRTYGTENVTPEMRQERKRQESLEKQRRKVLKQQQQNNQAQTRVVQAEQVNAKKLSVVERLKERSLRRQQQRLTREQAVQTAATQRMARGGPGAGKMAGIGMAASSAVMMGSMAPGQIGEIANKLMMPTMALSMALPMLSNGIGAVVAVLAAIPAAFFFLNQAFDKSTEKGLELAEAFGYGTEAIQKLAKASGNVTAGEIMDKRREEAGSILNIAPGKATFGETFLEGDVGGELLENLANTFKSGNSMQDVQRALVAQMGTAIATGALSAGQARSIVSELAEEMGNYQLGIAVNGELLSLFGPEGENLLEDPLEIRVKLIEESRENIRNIGSTIGPASSRAAGGMGLAVGAGGVIGGALGGSAAVNTAIGRVATTGLAKVVAGAFGRTIATTVTGSVAGPIGAAVGAVAGIATGVASVVSLYKDLGVAAGGFVAHGVMALQQQQELLDSLQIDYEKRIQIALAADDIAEAERLQNQYIEDRAALLEQNAVTMNTILEQYNNAGFLGQMRIGDTLQDQLKKMYEDDPLGLLAIEQDIEAIKDLDFGFFRESDREMELMLTLATGDIKPGMIQGLLNLDGDTIDLGIGLLTDLGADGGRMLSLMNMFVDKDGNPITEQQTKFLATVDAQPTTKAALDYLDLFTEISQVGNVADMQIVLDYYINDPNGASRLQRQLNQIQDVIAENEGELSIDAFANIYQDPEAQAALLAFADEFEQLDDVSKVEFIQAFTTLYNVDGDPEALENFRLGTGDDDATKADFDVSRAQQLVKAAQAEGDAGELTGEEETGGGGGGPKASPLDDMLKKLRDVRDSTIEVTKGWVASRNKLDELFGDGNDIKIFKGLKQQMRGLGLGEDLISVIAGMPADEFERRKEELFTFDEAGNITGMTTALGNMGRALRAVALGEYQNQQEATLSGLNEQIIAHRKLTAAGLSSAQAYEAIKDKAFAAAIAREKDNDVIRESIRLTEEATEVTRAFQAAQALARKNEETADLRGVTNFIQKNAAALSEAQKEAILSDKDLQALVMDPEVDPDTLRQALKDAENQADLDLKIKKLTFDGLVEIFNDGFNNAMEAFAVQEKRIELDFAVVEDPFLKAIEDAEREIADIRNEAGGLDDLQAELERISWQEKEINEKYEERKEALEKVKEINKTLSEQQKSQLDVAEALSRGDIAAAAKAAQELRQKQAQASQEKQAKNLEVAREKELAALVGASGRSRVEIEKEIERLNRVIFEIEEQRIEPARRQLDILGRQKEDLISNLTVLGKTRSEWERVKNNVDLARINTTKFIKAMEDALDVVEDIVDYWANFPETKSIDIFENVERRVTEIVEPEEAPAPDPKPDPGNGGGKDDEDEQLDPLRNYDPNTLLPDHLTGDLDRGMEEYRQENKKNEAWDVIGGTPEGYYDRPGVDPGIYGDATGGVRETELIEAYRSGKTPPAATGPNLWDKFTGWVGGLFGGGGTGGGSGSPAGETVVTPGSRRPTTGGTGGYDPMSGRYNPQSSGLMPPPASVGAPASLMSGRRGGATAGLGGPLGPVRNEITQLNNDIPSLLSGVDNFFMGIPERTNQPIVGGIGTNFQTLGSRAPQNLAGVPDYLKGPLAAQAEDGINSSIGGALRSTGNRAPDHLSGITSFISNDIPGAAQTTFGRKLPDHLTGLANQAPSDLAPIQSFFDQLPNQAGPKIENDLASSFLKLAILAPITLNAISSWFQGLPSMASVRGAIVIGIPALFVQSANLSIRMFSRIERYFRGLPATVRRLIQPISTMFYFEGRESAKRFIDEVNRQFNNFKPEVTITRRIITIYETQQKNSGGIIAGFNNGGGYQNLPMSRRVPGSGNYDKVKALLTPGEFVIRKEAVEKYGEGLMQVINSAKLGPEAFSTPTFNTQSASVNTSGMDAQSSGVMYNSNNYAINVNVKSEANPDQIARTVMNNIKRIDSQRIRSNRI